MKEKDEENKNDDFTLVKVWAGDRIIRYNSLKFLREQERKKARGIEKQIGKRLFAKVFIDASDVLGDESLSGSEYAVLMKLFRYITYDSCMLKYENGKYVSLAGIKRICKSMSSRTVEESVKKLLERGIMAVAKNGKNNVYIVNPYIFFRGTVPDEETENIFKETKWAKLFMEENSNEH